MANGKPGAKTKYTPDTVKAICDALSIGLSIKDACNIADIDQKTYERWSKQHVDFADAIEKAQSSMKARKLARIEKAGREGTWQADAWALERKHPEEFGQRLTIKIAPEDYDLLRKMGFRSPAEAWAALMENARKEYADAQSDS